jgi:hypothetical protein
MSAWSCRARTTAGSTTRATSPDCFRTACSHRRGRAACATVTSTDIDRTGSSRRIGRCSRPWPRPANRASAKSSPPHKPPPSAGMPSSCGCSCCSRIYVVPARARLR